MARILTTERRKFFSFHYHGIRETTAPRVRHKIMVAVRSITYVILGLGAVFTFGAMMSDAQWNIGFFVAALMFWAIAPYLALTLLNSLSKGSAAVTWISFVGAVAAVAYGVYVYVDIHRHLDAQGPLAYLFVPLVQCAWAGLLFVPWIFIAARRRFIPVAAAGPVKTGDQGSIQG